MNYYNPYFYSVAPIISSPKTGVFSSLFGNLSLGKIFNGTQKVLNLANQAIPLVKQVKPMIVNAKTMFNVMNEFKKVQKPLKTNYNSKNIKESDNVLKNESKNKDYIINDNGPTFFI